MALFSGVHYVLSSSIQVEWRRGLSGLLDLHGATSTPPHTHLIALAASHTQSEHQGSLHVVSGMWVQRSVVLGKRQLQRVSIVACATDLSRWDLEVLSASITSLGGQWRTALTRDVTHLFALHKQSVKYQTAMHFAPHTHMSVLTPHWFDDSVQAGCHVPEKPYLWPDPEVLGLASKIPILGLQFRHQINGQPHVWICKAESICHSHLPWLVLASALSLAYLTTVLALTSPLTKHGVVPAQEQQKLSILQHGGLVLCLRVTVEGMTGARGYEDEEEIVEGGRQRRRVQGIHYNATNKPGSPHDNRIVPTPVRARASAISWT
ncbi:hypothetical protein EDB19DRAFT_1835292 [Suillus lakei]|nr:hypothetical protein EDB19DRAFT_1835292 [Suillus lakei]